MDCLDYIKQNGIVFWVGGNEDIETEFTLNEHERKTYELLEDDWYEPWHNTDLVEMLFPRFEIASIETELKPANEPILFIIKPVKPENKYARYRRKQEERGLCACCPRPLMNARYCKVHVRKKANYALSRLGHTVRKYNTQYGKRGDRIESV